MKLINLMCCDLILLVVGSLISCENAEVDTPDPIIVCPSDITLYPKDALLLEVYSTNLKEESDSIFIRKYQYDDREKISRITTFQAGNGVLGDSVRYEEYRYDTPYVTEITTYVRKENDSFEKSSLLRWVYNENGKKEKQEFESLLTSENFTRLFYYEGDRLKRCDLYNRENLVSSVSYEYGEDGRITKETITSEGKPVSYLLYTYEKNAYSFVNTVEYKADEPDKVLGKMEKMYDLNDNLIYASIQKWPVGEPETCYQNRYFYSR